MAVSKELRRRIAEEYPAFAWLLDVPEVGNLLGTAANEGWDITKLQARLYATGWWKRTSESARQWDTLYKTDVATARQQANQLKSQIRSEAKRLGAKLTESNVHAIARNALRYQWDSSMVTGAIVAQVAQRGGIAKTGEIASAIGDLRALAGDYAMGISSRQLRQWAFEITSGSQTLDGVRAFMQAKAKADRGEDKALARALDRGMTVREYMAPTMGVVAEELGINPDTIDLTTGIGNSMMRFRDSNTGQLRTMDHTEAVQFARSHVNWRDTSNARSLASQLSDGITRKMGARA